MFLLGVFWKKASSKAAQYTLWSGSALGVLVYVSGKADPQLLLSNSPLMVAFYLFCACAALQVVLSYVFPMRHTAESSRLYWESPLAPLRVKGWPGLANYKVLSAVLLGVMAVLYWCFR